MSNTGRNQRFLTIATAKPITVMMPKGTRTIPIPEPSITTSGNVVALKLVSFVVMVTVINVVLEVILSLALVPTERNGIVVVLADVEKKLVVVLAAVKAMFKCNRFHSAMAQAGITRSFAGTIEHWSYTIPDDTADAAAEILRRMNLRST